MLLPKRETHFHKGLKKLIESKQSKAKVPIAVFTKREVTPADDWASAVADANFKTYILTFHDYWNGMQFHLKGQIFKTKIIDGELSVQVISNNTEKEYVYCIRKLAIPFTENKFLLNILNITDKPNFKV